MNIDRIKNVYLIGIGGIGMSGLARYFHHLGYLVNGYDKTETPLTSELIAEGISIVFEDSENLIPEIFIKNIDETLVIYTPAVPADSKIVQAFKNSGHVLHKRSEVLGFLSSSKFTIAIAGTHGKTTTSTLVAHILKDSGFDCSAFLGGISINYNSNVLFSSGNIMVVEADEFDRSFLTLHPDVAIVTSMDADHLDIYGDHQHLIDSFKLFIDQVKDGGTRIIYDGLDLPATSFYSIDKRTDIYASNIRIIESEFHFDYHHGEEIIKDIQLGIPGRHNVSNAVAAIAAAKVCGVPDEAIKNALARFRGIKRRFQYIVKNENGIYIDDYAHHPKELEACFEAVKSIYPDRTLTVLFQPHLFSRTRDFADDFAKVLSSDGIDKLILLPIYPAREKPIEGVSSEWLLDKIDLSDKVLLTPEGALKYIKEERPELILTVGAGDIDRLVKPIKEILTND
ncbi:UDP-N-acetylmuramate--L-alanine ligase [Albibacterium bauzanense]|uniref:UDP-N-acetylmuramate--L-alanine ligase n=1 Tax=Albibacterium bauzanense TaxID=653929 RepID=A0A4R1LVR8_9SPHI|nr:UDP-N-acetylmuramate--L-alanine ligase [Albibacterium bauzanense]TCK83526.1 UDP-N-acetylmuramate--L-alanine ligase [Albibacterium bauzanense]